MRGTQHNVSANKLNIAKWGGGGGGGEEVRWKTVRTYGKILATPLLTQRRDTSKCYLACSMVLFGLVNQIGFIQVTVFLLQLLLLQKELGNFKIYDAVVNENAIKQEYHWLKEEKYACCTCGTHFSARYSAQQRRERTNFQVLTTTRTYKLEFSFPIFALKPLMIPIYFWDTSPTLHDENEMD